MYGAHRDLHVLTHSFPTRRSSDLPDSGPRTPVRPGPAVAAAAWAGLRLQRGPWGGDLRSSVEPPQDGDAAVAQIAPPGDQPGPGAFNLAFAAIVAQLADRLDYVVEPPDVGFAEQAAMGVERIVPAKLDLTVLYKIERAARFAIAHRFELEQNDKIGRAHV